MPEESFPVRGVRQIAASLAGDEQLLAELFIALEDRDAMPVLRCLDCGKLWSGNG